jgi:C-terminal processing protease CtpA/Prc
MYEPEATGQTPEDFTKQFMEMARASNYGFRRVDELDDGVVVIGMSLVPVIDFSDANDPARRAADAALAKAVGAKAVILDLRNNGGGDTTMVGYLVSAFVKPGADVYNSFHERTKSSDERPAIEYPTPNTDVPLYILTNRRTGSAAESIAFTLQSAGRAKVIGERTGGAANPGDVFSTQQGFSVFVSTGTPRNPINGRNWERTGVAPDIETSPEGALDRALQLARE